MRYMRSFAKTTGTSAVLSLGTLTGGSVFAETAGRFSDQSAVQADSQARSSPRMALLRCLEAIEQPGRPADQRCSRQAMALCKDEASSEAMADCERTMAGGFLADGRELAQRSGNRGEQPGTFLRDWGKISARCARLGAEADDCRQATVREWWISARGGARLARVSPSASRAEVGSCSLE